MTKISLAGNQLGEEGTKFICEAMKGNKTVKELDLSGITDIYGQVISNIGGAAGAEHVAALLYVTASLTQVLLPSLPDIGATFLDISPILY